MFCLVDISASFFEQLIENKWCSHFEPLLEQSKDHDSREKILNSMMIFLDKCHGELSSSVRLASMLKYYEQMYTKLLAEDKYDEYFSKLLNNIEEMEKKLNRKNEL